MANASEATVIFLQSHPAWIAAQQRDHQLEEEMRLHPAFWVGNAAERSAEVAVSTRDLTVCPGADTPA